MSAIESYVLLGIVFVVIAALVFLSIYTLSIRNHLKLSQAKKQEAEIKIAQAQTEADRVLKSALSEAQNLAVRDNKEFEKLQREKTSELQKIEKRIQKHENTLTERAQQLDNKEQELKSRLKVIEREEKRLQENIQKTQQTLEESQKQLQNIARLSADEAKHQLMESLEGEVRKSIAADVKRMEDDARRTAEDKARSIIATAIQRSANEFVGDACVSVVSLPSDDMKGRIIGREGRNIRAIEQATGVDIIIDDTPEAIILSCFNPVRREIAKLSLEKLLVDGRIHPSRIEEVVQKVTKEIDQTIREAGERSSFDLGVQNLHPEIITMLGNLKFRTTGMQSILQHSVETAEIAGVIAGELGLNVRLAKRAGLLHDIGKSIDQDHEGSHAHVGAELLRKYGESPEVVEAVAKHHNDQLHGSDALAVVIQAANTLSSFRPGARKEFIENSINRLRDMETIAAKFEGVEQAFVIRSGKEIRALVSSSISDDAAVSVLARSVAKKIRSELNQPGQIKVTMIRETRSVEFAK